MESASVWRNRVGFSKFWSPFRVVYERCVTCIPDMKLFNAETGDVEGVLRIYEVEFRHKTPDAQVWIFIEIEENLKAGLTVCAWCMPECDIDKMFVDLVGVGSE